MEVALLWLDDLDDVLFSAALRWEQLRRAVLGVGLAAAFALAVSELFATATQWAPAFFYVAAGSVLAWLGGGALRAYYYRHRERLPTPA